MSIHDIPVRALDGAPATLQDRAGEALLIVNVASKCGFTPHYEGLQRLYEELHPRGFSVLGFPCNQFGGQEPGSPEEIATFCSINYGVTFPLFEKCDVNGDDRHPLFAALTALADPDGEAGDVKWNFEKFVVDPAGGPVARFRTGVKPDDPELVTAIEGVLPA